MDALKDIWASLVSGLRDRTTNPLTVSFAFSWALWNYKFFIVLYGDETGTEKLAAIEKLYPPAEAAWQGGALLFPLMTASFYVFLYPLIGMLAIWVYRKYQVLTSNMVKTVEKTRTLSQEEAAIITRRHERERKKWEEDSASQLNQIAELRRALNSKDELQDYELKQNLAVDTPTTTMSSNTSVTSSQQTEKDSNELSADFEIKIDVAGNKVSLSVAEKELLLRLSEWASLKKAVEIAESLAKNFSVVEQQLRQLAVKKLVIEESMYTGTGWVLTPSGREAAVFLLKQA